MQRPLGVVYIGGMVYFRTGFGPKEYRCSGVRYIYSTPEAAEAAKRSRIAQQAAAEKRNKRRGKMKADKAAKRQAMRQRALDAQQAEYLRRTSEYREGSRKRPDYRPGMDSLFYETTQWQNLRYQTIRKYGARCQCCGATKTDGVRLHVDHIKPRFRFPLLELDPDNLQVLCEPCNKGKSWTDQTDWRTPAGLSLSPTKAIKAATG